MTDRVSGYLVVLAEDTREDDAEATTNAIRQVKGVLSVQPLQANPTLDIATARVKADFRSKLYSVLK